MQARTCRFFHEKGAGGGVRLHMFRRINAGMGIGGEGEKSGITGVTVLSLQF